MKIRATLIKGDGIGPEVTGATCQVLHAAGAPIEWQEALGGLAAGSGLGGLARGCRGVGLALTLRPWRRAGGHEPPDEQAGPSEQTRKLGSNRFTHHLGSYWQLAGPM